MSERRREKNKTSSFLTWPTSSCTNTMLFVAARRWLHELVHGCSSVVAPVAVVLSVVMVSARLKDFFFVGRPVVVRGVPHSSSSNND